MSSKSKKHREKEAEPADQYEYKAPRSLGGKVVTEPGFMGKPARFAEQAYESPEDATVIVSVRMTERDGPSKKGAPRIPVNDASVTVMYTGANNILVKSTVTGGNEELVKRTTTTNGIAVEDTSLKSKEVLDMIRQSFANDVFDVQEAHKIATKLLSTPAKTESIIAVKARTAPLP